MKKEEQREREREKERERERETSLLMDLSVRLPRIDSCQSMNFLEFFSFVALFHLRKGDPCTLHKI